MWEKPYMPASAGQPSLHGIYACMVCWNKGALPRNCRQKRGMTSFSPLWFFLLSRNSRKPFWGFNPLVSLGGRARHPGPAPLEVFNVGRRLVLIFLLLLSKG